MKLAYSIGTPETNGSLMAFTGDFEENVKQIKSIGYDALELFVRDPDAMDTASVEKVIEKSGLGVAGIGTNPAMSQDGLTLLSKDFEVRKQAVSRVISMIDYAATFNAPVCIGKYRGNLWSGDEENAMRTLVSSFEQICDHAYKKGVGIMLEPQNKGNLNNLNTSIQAADWIDQNGFTNVQILFDLFHGDLAEISVASGILGARGKIGFVHCSDSERYPPGLGKIHMADAFAVLKSVGFDGYVSMEIAQKPNSIVAAETSYKVISYLINNLL